ncbi:MAG TPA: crosslink repair DNA glycosylase YcaQ family protein [Rhizomicrobium sp.]|nr:crosslink repair DNA glycosylase YcaQ family protein [Rhizomicrobium sp.]
MSKTPLHIPNATARALILAHHGLSGVRQEGGAGSVAPLIRKLGYVQLDSIRIVERAHHHILFSRHTGYRPRHLDRLQAKTPALFEHWTHDSSLIPLEHYPHWRHRFAKSRANIAKWRERFGDDRVLGTVRAHIEQHGAARARDFAHLGGRTGPWWGWGPAKAALEFLWRTGELAVLERDGFEKIYDLSERTIPKALRMARPSRSETHDWAHDQALARLGAGTARMIADFWGHASIPEAAKWIETEKQRGRLIDVTLEGAGEYRGFQAVARPGIEAEIAALPAPTSRLRVLSPFDPILRDRARVERIFGFDYRIEVFVPGPKRKYGYYVFPLLEGDRFVGRIDMKAERSKDALAIKALWMEARLRLTTARRAKLERELARQAKLGGVRDILFPADAIKTL